MRRSALRCIRKRSLWTHNGETREYTHTHTHTHTHTQRVRPQTFACIHTHSISLLRATCSHARFPYRFCATLETSTQKMVRLHSCRSMSLPPTTFPARLRLSSSLTHARCHTLS